MKTVTCKDTGEVCRTYQEYLSSRHWESLKQTYRQAKFSCECYACNSKNNLNLHHKSYDRIGNERLQDLIYLCKSCHGEVHYLLRAYFNKLIVVPIKDRVQTEKEVRIWCAASGFPDCLGWAFILEYKGHKKEFCGVATRDQNNMGNVILFAIVEALGKLKESCNVTIITKDVYAIKGINTWMDKWAKKDFKTKKGYRINTDYWRKIATFKQKHNIIALYTNGQNPAFRRIHELAHEKARLMNAVIYKEVVGK